MPRSVRRFTGIRGRRAPKGGRRRGWSALIGAVGAIAVASAGVTGAAAAPQPTVTQVQHRLAVLNTKIERLVQQYDQVGQQLAQSDQRQAFLSKQTVSYRAHFDAMRQQVGRLATAAFEEGGATSPIALLTSSSPQQVLNQSAILSELSSADRSQIGRYLAASRQLLWAQQVAKREAAQIGQLRGALHKRLAALNSLKAVQQALLAQLTPAQQVGLGPGGGSTGGTYNGPTKTQAEKAVWFAYHQLGCPYNYGKTGPCSIGYDCSGLVQSAWAYAGISIPRTSQEMFAPNALLAVSLSNLQLGDILGFGGNSHVGIYVGGGYMIDSPHTGATVEKVQLAGYYLQNLDGAVRP